MSEPRSITILVVDDDDVATESIARSLRKHDIQFPVVDARDGVEALELLRNTHPSRRLGKPYIVLLDLNMPRMNGFEFLQEIRADAQLKDTVIFVLTTSTADADRTRAYQESIAGYMVKSAVGPQFSKLAQLLSDYHAAVELPK